MLEGVRAAIGDENMQKVFWTVIGGLVLSNVGLLIKAGLGFFRKQIKLRTDINEAFKRIRKIEREINLTNQENENEVTSTTLPK